MSKPHLCPKCFGERKICTNGLAIRVCPVCRGEGVLWEPAGFDQHLTLPFKPVKPIDPARPRKPFGHERPLTFMVLRTQGRLFDAGLSPLARLGMPTQRGVSALT